MGASAGSRLIVLQLVRRVKVVEGFVKDSGRPLMLLCSSPTLGETRSVISSEPVDTKDFDNHLLMERLAASKGSIVFFCRAS